MTRQAIFALLLLALDAAYFFQALSLPLPFAAGEPGPSFMPLILVVVLGVSCLGILVQEMRGTVSDDQAEEVHFGWKTVALIALTAAFVWAFDRLGYWIATVLYTFAVAWLFEQERLGAGRAMLSALAIAVGITLAGWLFFVTLFELFLPQGVL